MKTHGFACIDKRNSRELPWPKKTNEIAICPTDTITKILIKNSLGMGCAVMLEQEDHLLGVIGERRPVKRAVFFYNLQSR